MNVLVLGEGGQQAVFWSEYGRAANIPLVTSSPEDPLQPTCPTCDAALPSPGAPCPQCAARQSAETVAVTSVPGADEELELVRSALDDEYEVLEELGRGGMAIVYRARERALDRDVAVKVLPVARTFDSELVERFQREARLAAGLDHPHIIPIYRVGQVDRVNFLVMKFVRGPSVSAIVREQEKMRPAEVAKMLVQVSEALDHAHGQGVVHRDIKPDNIMRDASGRYVVMDFGIARPMGGAQLTQVGESMGTPKYMSPEQARAGELDGRSDFYSLGVVAFECLVGRPPFSAPDPMAVLYSHLQDAVPEPTFDSDAEREIFSVIRRLLEKDPDRRLQDADGVREALEGVDVDGSPPSPSTTRMQVVAKDLRARVERWWRDRFRTGAGTSRPPSTGFGPGAGVPERLLRFFRSRRRRAWVAAVGLAGVLLIVVLAREGATARCRAALPDASEGDRAVLMESLGTVTQGAELDIGYIACGVPRNDPFTVQLAIRPVQGGGLVGGVRRLFGGGADPVRLGWDEVSDGFATSRTRTVSPGPLEPGSYQASLRLRDVRGREAEASLEFLVVAPEPGS